MSDHKIMFAGVQYDTTTMTTDELSNLLLKLNTAFEHEAITNEDRAKRKYTQRINQVSRTMAMKVAKGEVTTREKHELELCEHQISDDKGVMQSRLHFFPGVTIRFVPARAEGIFYFNKIKYPSAQDRRELNQQELNRRFPQRMYWGTFILRQRFAMPLVGKLSMSRSEYDVADLQGADTPESYIWAPTVVWERFQAAMTLDLEAYFNGSMASRHEDSEESALVAFHFNTMYPSMINQNDGTLNGFWDCQTNAREFVRRVPYMTLPQPDEATEVAEEETEAGLEE